MEESARTEGQSQPETKYRSPPTQNIEFQVFRFKKIIATLPGVTSYEKMNGTICEMIWEARKEAPKEQQSENGRHRSLMLSRNLVVKHDRISFYLMKVPKAS